ncbi:hypothetical protein [Crocinitomix catalasitica]|uniref:hypothetical protein n=1 Tax=Crocinitomix catalasitica TaxID=184607 RepID=UPI000480C7B8|nr:hypothetical protein [Crocinitomix catalasitica]
MNTKDIASLIKEIEVSNPDRLQVKGDSTREPRPIGFYNAMNKVIPDVVAIYSNKRDFYAIEKNIVEKEIHVFIFKWILFASEARKHGGKFYLVIPKGKSELVEGLIAEKQLDINLIEI